MKKDATQQSQTEKKPQDDLKSLVYGIINDYAIDQIMNNYKLSHVGLREDIEELITQQVQDEIYMRAQAKNITKVTRQTNDVCKVVEQLVFKIEELKTQIKDQSLIIKNLEKENRMLRVRTSDLEDNQDILAEEMRAINDREETVKRLRKVY